MTVVELADAVPAGAMIAISDTLANMQRAAVAERARTADRSAARESDLSRHDEVSASFDRDAARAGSSFEFEHSDASRAYLRALGFGREDEQTRKNYEGQKLDLAAAPLGEWLCRDCVTDGHKAIEAIEGKGSDDQGHVLYHVRYQGSGDRVSLRAGDFPKGAELLRRAFLAAARAASSGAALAAQRPRSSGRLASNPA